MKPFAILLFSAPYNFNNENHISLMLHLDLQI
jgi:hypothetical protein